MTPVRLMLHSPSVEIHCTHFAPSVPLKPRPSCGWDRAGKCNVSAKPRGWDERHGDTDLAGGASAGPASGGPSLPENATDRCRSDSDPGPSGGAIAAAAIRAYP